MLGAESERGDPTRLGLLAASINVEVDIRGTGPDAFTLGVPEVEDMEQGPYNSPNGWQLLIITQSRTQLKQLSSSSRMAAFGKSVSSPAFVFHWFVLQFVSLIWKMLTLASTKLKKQKNFFHTSWEEEGDKTLEPRWSGNSVCKEQLRVRRGVITVVWLDGSRILHCHLRQGPLW